MTRDFNNQRREDPQSDSRGSSSRRFEEERPSRPARPRLNRDMVDRAWENGARQNHADYRTRSESNSHPPRDSRRPNQHSNRYSAQNSSNGRKPYGNRKDNYRPGEHSSRSNNGPRPRSFESSMRTFDGQNYNEYERRGYSNQPYRDDYHPGNRGNSQHPNSRSQYQGRGQYRGAQQREFDRDDRQPRSYDRDKRSSRNTSGPDTHNPRWQSRPERQLNNYSNRPHEYTRDGAEQELFEGDYEHFDKNNSADFPTSASTKGKPNPRTNTASASTRARKTPKAKVRQSTPKPRSTGPKPSQRGYKWPTPEA